MIIEFEPRFTYYGKQVIERVDSGKLSLAGASRLLLGDTIESHSREGLQIIVVERLLTVLERGCDEFYGTEKKDAMDFQTSMSAIILLLKNNLLDIIEGLNGEKNELQELAGLIHFDYNLRESGVKKNGIFGTNLRILIAACFRNERFSGLVNDISECLRIQSRELPFTHMIQRFHYELSRFASESIHLSERDDMYQEGCIVLWNCVNKYSGQNFIPFRQYFLRSLRNKTTDLLRKMHTDKRKISLKTRSSSTESFNESKANGEVAKRYMDGYHEWLNSADNDGDNSFVAPNTVGQYFPEIGKSVTEAQKIKAIQDIFNKTMEALCLYVETQISKKHFDIFKEFFSVRHIGMIFLRFLFGNPRENTDLDIMQQNFLQTYMKGCIYFDGEEYCFQDLGDVQEKFLAMCQEIIQKDPMIQLAFRVGRREYTNEVPF